MVMVIKKVENGYILETTSGEETSIKVVEAKCEDEEVEAFRDLLWEINDAVGPMTSRYSAKRIVVSIEPGDKHSDGQDG